MPDNFFQPVAWSSRSNIYEINLRQYTYEGSFAEFSKSLPRLKDMGIEILWFMPITPIAVEKRLGTLGSYYACSDYTSINPEYGTLDDFKQFMKEAHGLGFKVIIDWVANHTGYGHTWTSTNPDFYKKNADGAFYDAYGWEDVIDLDYSNPDLWTTMIGCMEFWINECDIDGFRCDMAHLVPLEFWKSARTTLDAKKKLFWLAECEEINYHEVFDATYAWKLLHTMESYYKGGTDLEGLNANLQYYKDAFPATALRMLFTSNHDENSHSGSEFERLGDAAKVFAVLTCTWDGLPLIYSGQEATNIKRIKFFDKDFIEWSHGYPFHDFYKTLLNLRRSNPALEAGNPETAANRIQTDSDNRLLAFSRKKDGHELLVFLNLSADYYWINLLEESIGGSFTNIFTGEQNDISKNRYFEMRPWDFYVYEKNG